MRKLRSTQLPSGETIPVLGQGTWMMGERRQRRADEIAALRAGVDLGMTLIDTAEMYGDGAAEQLIAEALGERRDELFLVDKVLPQHASRRGTIAACDASLRRLKTDRIDLYLLHWRGSVPLEETLLGFADLASSGKIRHWGVSNFDADDMDELARLSPASPAAVNQVLYNLTRRGIEYKLLPLCRSQGIPIMAYSPVEQGRLLNNRALKGVADRLKVTPAQVALAWVLRHPDVIAIPKAGNPEHVRDNRAALELTLDAEALRELDLAFPPPKKATALEML
jgi:diketogulonate reductase-like aldo/keto reductase